MASKGLPAFLSIPALSVAMACAAVAAAAQDRDEPRMERLAAAFQQEYLRLGMLLQTVADFQADRVLPAENGFSIANARLLLRGDLDRGFGYAVQTDFAGTPAILEARISYRANRHVAFDVGQFKAPFSREFLTFAGSIDFVNRSQAVAALAPGWQLGAQARLRDARGVVALTGGVFNGNGTRANANDDGRLMYVARVSVTPSLGPPGGGRTLEVAANAAFSEDAAAPVDGGFQGSRAHLGGDARLTLGRWLASGEVAYTRLRPVAGAGRDPWGFHATAGYMLSGTAQLLARLDGFDADLGGERSDWLLLGFNAWPTTATELQVNYVIDLRDAALRHHQWLVNFQLGF